MRKKILFGIIMVLTLVVLFLCAPTVHAGSYTVGEKTITFEKFSLEGIDEEIISVWDFKNNTDGILLLTENQKIYHMNLDETVEEITWEEQGNLYNEGKLLEDYKEYCAYSDEEPEEFSKVLPELTFVEGTGDNIGSYAVKIGEDIVSDYEYSDNFDIISEETGKVIVGIGQNKTTNKFDLWINTKTSSKLVTINNDGPYIGPSDDSAFLTIYTYNDEGNDQLIVFDWSGNEIISLEATDAYYVVGHVINTYNQKLLPVGIFTDDGLNIEIYDLDGNRVLKVENFVDMYAYQFGMLECISYANTSKIVDIKNNITISDVIETEHMNLCATTVKLKKTSEDYLAPGKYYFVTFENEVYEMTISYTMLQGANSSINKTSAENLTVKVDGDLEKLEGIYVDNEKLDENNYTLAEGSTIVTLKNEYLKTLEVGEHTLKVEYLDGDVETKFIITEEIIEDDTQTPGETPNEGNQGTDDEGKETTGTDDKKDDTISPEILPNTGKFAVISILIVTFVVGVISFIKTRKYKGI